MTALTTIIVATPSITLITLASAMYRVLRYRQQSKYLYTSATPSVGGRKREIPIRLRDPGRARLCPSRLGEGHPKGRAGRLALPESGKPIQRPRDSGCQSLSLRPHERKQNDVTNTGPVQEDHAQPVDADPQPAGRRHRVPSARMKSSSILAIDSSAGSPASCLRNSSSCKPGIIELGVGVGQLDPMNIELEPLGHGRVRRLALGERAKRRRVIDHEDRPAQVVLDHGLEKLSRHDHRVLAGRRRGPPRPRALTCSKSPGSMPAYSARSS